jgi:hypothetical protein
LRLGIEKEGVYSVSASDLQRHGITIPKEQINTIKIFGQSGQIMPILVGTDLSMQEQEIIVNTNPDGTLANIIFYGSGVRGLYMGDSVMNKSRKIITQRHYLNYMDTKNYYLLTYGKTDGKRAVGLPTPDGAVISKPLSYRATMFHNEDKFMPPTPGSGVI